ncbi:MAG: 7TM diverse intracellular signaling domain-containing protein, partial [Campylobacteraceae bacterium]
MQNFLLVFLLFFTTNIFALDITPKEVSVYKQIDMTYNLKNIDDALSNPEKFETVKAFTRILRRAKSNNDLWLKIPLVNDSDRNIYKVWVTRWERASFDLFLVDDEGIKIYEKIDFSDDFLKQSSTLFIPAHSKKTLYIHVKTKKALDQFNYIYFIDAPDVKKFIIDTDKYYHHGLFFGILLAMTIYSFFTYFATNSKEFLFLGFYQTWVLIATSHAWQYFYELLENFQNIAHILLTYLYTYGIAFFYILFTKAFFNTKEKMPKFNTFLNISLIILIPLDLWNGPIDFGGFVSVVFIIVGFYSAYKGNVAAFFYAFGFLGFEIYYLAINISRIFDWNIYYEFTNARQIFACIESFVFSIAIYIKMKSIVKEKNLAQESSLRYEKLMLEQSRFAALGEMIASIAHQWRQPLNHLNLIINNLRMAQRGKKLNDEYLESKTLEAEQQLQYMSTTIEDFSTFFAQKGKQEEFSLKEVCEYAIKLVESRSKKQRVTI